MTDEERARALREFEEQAAAGVVNNMRQSLSDGRMFEYGFSALALVQHMEVVQHAMRWIGQEFDRAHALLVADAKKGAIVH